MEYFGCIINAGSRDEASGYEGLAHFVEHTIFKGTKKRRSNQILNRIECIGGELNAYTTKEETVIYSISPFGHLRRSVELIYDIIVNSCFPENEIKKEKLVVDEEILSYLDTPSEDIYDKFDSYIFKNSSLEHNILGSKSTLANFNTEICRNWVIQKFIPCNSVLFYSGKATPRKVLKVIESYFCSILSIDTTADRKEPIKNPIFHHNIKIPSLHQSHCVLGLRIPSLYSSQRPLYTLISNFLGGQSMNSLLNMELREKRGLVYTIESSIITYTDCGLLTIYYGCDPNENDYCLEIIRRTLNNLVKNGIKSSKLKAVKRQFIGQMSLSYENHEQNILSQARSMLHLNKMFTLSDNISIIENITLEDINRIIDSFKFDSFSSLIMNNQ